MAMKDDQAHLPDLITALLDEEEPVVRAARAGLKAISGGISVRSLAPISLIGRRRRKPGSTGSASRSNRRLRQVPPADEFPAQGGSGCMAARARYRPHRSEFSHLRGQRMTSPRLGVRTPCFRSDWVGMRSKTAAEMG